MFASISNNCSPCLLLGDAVMPPSAKAMTPRPPTYHIRLLQINKMKKTTTQNSIRLFVYFFRIVSSAKSSCSAQRESVRQLFCQQFDASNPAEFIHWVLAHKLSFSSFISYCSICQWGERANERTCVWSIIRNNTRKQIDWCMHERMSAASAIFKETIQVLTLRTQTIHGVAHNISVVAVFQQVAMTTTTAQTARREKKKQITCNWLLTSSLIHSCLTRSLKRLKACWRTNRNTDENDANLNKFSTIVYCHIVSARIVSNHWWCRFGQWFKEWNDVLMHESMWCDIESKWVSLLDYKSPGIIALAWCRWLTFETNEARAQYQWGW